MVEPLFVMLPSKLDADFREAIRKKTGEYKHGDRSRITREIIAEWIIKNNGSG